MNTAKIRLVATDLDGTLLDSQKQVPDGFFKLARHLNEHGVVVAIVSGRQYYNILKLFEPVQDCLTFVADNGALVFHRGECVYKSVLDETLTHEALSYVSARPEIHPLVCGVKSAYGEPCEGEFAQHVGFYYECRDISVGSIARGVACDETVKLAFFNEGDASASGFPLLCKRFDGRLSVTLSGFHWVDMMRLETDKGAAIRFLQQRLGIAPEESMAFGDYGNDSPMLRACAQSFAMANATDDVKAQSRHVLKWSNDEAGVLRKLNEVFCLQNQ